MGFLLYSDGSEYEFDDRTLAHLKVAITSKLRLKEGFLLSWRVPAEEGGGRVSLWLSPAIALQFRFTDATPPALNRKWLEGLSRSSHGPRGMIVLSEEDAEKLSESDLSDPQAQKHIQKALDEVG
ncbi:DUF7882 family protein [Humibacter ginsenosidimutans]|uniref:DUF7882 domain-containing protein n=1 Tax=Humibacter ginsenosidimutans TaxID=2599293 RepID=A0A5B8M4L1_9MICO|nr:hypothetical protein [Humibacter ginsenosidimutans]QDZ15161.1 hypothetical protein FPZ11_10615 [Humibacter ginsenosidimutans]